MRRGIVVGRVAMLLLLLLVNHLLTTSGRIGVQDMTGGTPVSPFYIYTRKTERREPPLSSLPRYWLARIGVTSSSRRLWEDGASAQIAALLLFFYVDIYTGRMPRVNWGEGRARMTSLFGHWVYSTTQAFIRQVLFLFLFYFACYVERLAAEDVSIKAISEVIDQSVSGPTLHFLPHSNRCREEMLCPSRMISTVYFSNDLPIK